MADYDRNLRDPSNLNRVPVRAYSSGTWIGAAVLVVVLLIAIGYVFSDRTSGPLVEHRAAATDTTAPASPAVAPLASPDASPKP